MEVHTYLEYLLTYDPGLVVDAIPSPDHDVSLRHGVCYQLQLNPPSYK